MTKPRDSPTERSPFALEILFCVIVGIAVGINPPTPAGADKPYVMESVYNVKEGHSEEYLQLLRMHQLKILDREKALGTVVSYAVYHPRLRASEGDPWDYRIVTVYKQPPVPAQVTAIEKQ